MEGWAQGEDTLARWPGTHELQLFKSLTNTRKITVSKGYLILLTNTLPPPYHKDISMRTGIVGFFFSLPLTDLESLMI